MKEVTKEEFDAFFTPYHSIEGVDDVVGLRLLTVYGSKGEYVVLTTNKVVGYYDWNTDEYIIYPENMPNSTCV